MPSDEVRSKYNDLRDQEGKAYRRYKEEIAKVPGYRHTHGDSPAQLLADKEAYQALLKGGAAGMNARGEAREYGRILKEKQSLQDKEAFRIGKSLYKRKRA